MAHFHLLKFINLLINAKVAEQTFIIDVTQGGDVFLLHFVLHAGEIKTFCLPLVKVFMFKYR